MCFFKGRNPGDISNLVEEEGELAPKSRPPAAVPRASGRWRSPATHSHAPRAPCRRRAELPGR